VGFARLELHELRIALMSALYGSSGSHAARWATHMRAHLSHRGSKVAETPDSPLGVMGHRRWPKVQTSTGSFDPEGGAAWDSGAALVLSGWLRRTASGATEPQALLEEWHQLGVELLASLEGDFVLAIRDGERFYLVRDPLGARTAYFSQLGGCFAFASEVKALLALPGHPRRLRAAALAQFLTFSFVPGSGTMLEGVSEVPAGHFVSYDERHGVRTERYFHFEHSPASSELEPENSPDTWVKRFRTTLEHAVAERSPSGGPIGVALSGGLDSSIVTAEVAHQHPGSVCTYALHFGAEYPHELEFARKVAQRCRTQHTEVEIRPQSFLPDLRRMIWSLDEPSGDPITMPNFKLAEHMRRDVRFVFNGEGGDPVFGGPKNLPMLMQHVYGGIERGPGFRERAYLASYRRAYEEIERLLLPEWRETLDRERDLEGLITPFFAAREPQGFLEKLLAINIRLKGAHLILPKVERMTAAFGITPLSPLFDEKLVRLAFQMPGRMKLAAGVEKIVMKRAYAEQLPLEVIKRPKSGMRVPVSFWFRGELRRYARSILSRRAVRRAGWFDPERVQQLLAYRREDLPGRHGLRLWMLITLELWRRIVLEGERP